MNDTRSLACRHTGPGCDRLTVLGIMPLRGRSHVGTTGLRPAGKRGDSVRDSSTTLACLALISTTLCTGCASFVDSVFRSQSQPISSNDPSAHPYGEFGRQPNVLSTLRTVKAAGSVRVLGSHAVHLPIKPLSAVTVFDYQLPEACGGHSFRVYEFEQTQILEYVYVRENGQQESIRDYITGPSPFVKPGLWTSYDHTARGIGEMRTEFVGTNARRAPSVYSRGLVTGLEGVAQRELDVAYRRALVFAESCNAAPESEFVTLASP